MQWFKRPPTRSRIYRELSEEIQQHLAEKIDALMADGMSREDAQYAARREFGNITRMEESGREVWMWVRGENILAEIEFALGKLIRSPGFSVSAVLTLALGIGALTTVATWTNAVLYNPWPHVAAPRELRFVDATVLGNNGYSVHYDQYQFVRAQGRSFQDAVAFAKTTVSLTLPGAESQAIGIGVVSSNYFQFLGLRAQAGRVFLPGANDRAYGAQAEIVLSDALWRDRFNADANMIGRTISINQHAFTVVGVGPPEFAGIFGGVAEAAWIPLSALLGNLHYGAEREWMDRCAWRVGRRPRIDRGRAPDALYAVWRGGLRPAQLRRRSSCPAPDSVCVGASSRAPGRFD
jgi:hypothetical protein